MRGLSFLSCSLLSILISFQALPYPSYFYNRNKNHPPASTVNRYIKPQMRSIIQEFYLTLKKLHPLNANLIENKNLIMKMRYKWDKWRNECEAITDVCNKKLSDIYQISRNLEKKHHALQKKVFSKSYFKSQRNIDSLLKLAGSIDNLSNLNYKLLHRIEEILIMSHDGTKQYMDRDEELTHTIHIMHTFSEQNIVSQLPYDVLIVYTSVWLFFIKNLETFLMLEKDTSFLLERLEELNSAWNSFHMRIAKGIVFVPQNVVNIHNRWNSILKLVLKNKAR